MLVWQDGFHEPKREIRDINKIKIASPIERMKGVLDLMFTDGRPFTPGFEVSYLPNREAVLSRLSRAEAASCLQWLTAIGK